MNRKTFWLLITVIAVACIVLPAVSSAYNALNSDKKIKVRLLINRISRRQEN